jgi:hypothetical protein
VTTPDAGDAEADDLRLAFAGALNGAHDMIGCPPAEDVWDAFHGVLAPERRRQVVDHTAGCPMCAVAWRHGVRGTPGLAPDRS